jgi:leucyl-tRNA---protein transferase
MKLQINREEVEHAIHLGDVSDPCPYIPGQTATFRFGNGHLVDGHYQDLLDWGYRRSGNLVYRPVCSACQACQILRVPISSFRRSKSQRRVWNKGRGVFDVRWGAPSYTDEKAALYARYLAFQHSTMEEPMDEARYSSFLVDTCLEFSTLELQYYAGEQLVGVGIVDRLDKALSTVYFYFDPDFATYSPGTWSALFELELAAKWGLDHYYLGYYVEQCDAMNYKSRFRPCEMKRPDELEWLPCKGP